MELRLCSTEECQCKAEISCAGSHPTQYFCLEHFHTHSSEYGMHQIIDLENASPQIEVNTYEILQEDQHQTDKFRIFQANKNVFLMDITNIPIKMPEDYMKSATRIAMVFIDSICMMPGGKFEKLDKQCRQFAEALNKLIYNLELDYKNILDIIKEIYAKLHSQLAEQAHAGLLKLVDSAQKILDMPETIRQNIFFTVKLSDQRSRFFEAILLANNYSIDNIKKVFYEHFRDFFKDSDQNIYDQLKSFDKVLQSEKAEMINIAKEEFLKYFEAVVMNALYLRSGVFTLRFSPDLIRSGLTTEWIMLLSLILKEDSPKLHSVTEISSFEIIISVLLKSTAFLIYHAWNNSNILMILPCVDFVVASGSTPSSVLVAQNYPKSIDEYSIVSNKLQKLRRYEFSLETFERIEHLALDRDHNKAFFTTDIGTLNMKSLDSPARTKIPLNLNGEKCVGLTYIAQKTVVCLKTHNFLRIFTGGMDLLHTFPVQGSFFTYICSDSTCRFYILGDRKISSLDSTIVGREPAENQARVPARLIELTACSFSMSQDFVFGRSAKPDPYLEYINRRFDVPDCREDFEEVIVGECLQRVPGGVAFLDYQGGEVKGDEEQGGGLWKGEEEKIGEGKGEGQRVRKEREEEGEGEQKEGKKEEEEKGEKEVEVEVEERKIENRGIEGIRQETSSYGGNNPEVEVDIKETIELKLDSVEKISISQELSNFDEGLISAVLESGNDPSTEGVSISTLILTESLSLSHQIDFDPHVPPNPTIPICLIPDLANKPNEFGDLSSNSPIKNPSDLPNPYPSTGTVVNLPPMIPVFSSDFPAPSSPNRPELPFPSTEHKDIGEDASPHSFPRPSPPPESSLLLPVPHVIDNAPSSNLPVPFPAAEESLLLSMPPNFIPVSESIINQGFNEPGSDENKEPDED